MYKKLYLALFRAVTKAIEEFGEQNYGTAKHLLVQAQIDCEELYMQLAEDSEDIDAVEIDEV